MKTIGSTLQCLMKQDFPLIIHKESDGYSACVPSLGILVLARTLDECYAEIEERKRSILGPIVERGFGDSILSVRLPSSNPRSWIRMIFALLAMFLVLLTILIPADYVLSELTRRVPTYVETAMDVVQRRMHQMSDNDQRQLSGLATRMCPVIDEMVEARCKRVPSDGVSTTKGKLR